MNIIKLVGKPLSINSKRRIKKFILKNVYFDRLAATYDAWIVKNFPDALELMKQSKEVQDFAYKPLISITVPTYNTPENFLRECIESVFTQSYENWELVLVDDASPDPRTREVIEEYASKDERIKYKFLDKNLHIAGATNEAIKLSTGEFIGLFDHDDLLWPNALYEVVKALNHDKEIDFLYTDEDKIVEERGRHVEPFFKPDWSPALLRTCNYITHFSVFKRELLDKVGYEDGTYNGAQDWEMFMRATRSAKKVHHIAKVVYSWRVHDASTAKTMDSKPYVIAAQKATVVDDLHARGYKDFSVQQHSKFFAFWKTILKNIGEPKVSVIVLGKRQLGAIRRKTTYKNCEYIYAQNYADGIKQATGEYVVFFEPDIRVTSKSWVETLLGSAVQDGTGLVGGLTTYANGGYIYSAGISINQNGKLVHVLSGGISVANPKTLTRTVYIHARRNTTALSGCVMVKKANLKDFRFSSTQTTGEQLIALAIELIERGFNNVYDPGFTTKISKRYFEKKKYENKGLRKTYKDRPVEENPDELRGKKAAKQRYFYDDLVSHPDTDVL